VKTYTATITLYVSEFQAENEEDAQKKVEAYLDTISADDGVLSWPDCDWALCEADPVEVAPLI
jgi:hypothetical protein